VQGTNNDLRKSSDTLLNKTANHLNIPLSLLNIIYNRPEVQQLYSENEINNFINRWKTNKEQQGYQDFWRLRLAEARLTLSPRIKDYSKLIIIAGLPRSGSTLLFNIVRLILEQTDSGTNLGYIDPKEVETFLTLYENRPISCLIKVHEWNPLFQKYLTGGARVIFSYRDIRDSAVSALHKGFIEDGKTEILNFIRSNMKMSQLWEHAQNLLEVKYEVMAFNVSKLVEVVGDFIPIVLSPEKIRCIANSVDYDAALKSSKNLDNIVSLRNGRTVFDAETQLHKDHLAGGKVGKYVDVFPRELTREIEKISYYWIKSHGYTPQYYHPEKPKRYYAKYGEDFVLWSFFNSQKHGFFVDIGAFDGVYLSNTYSFELRGWEGICVEANPEYTRLLNKNRLPVSTSIQFL